MTGPVSPDLTTLERRLATMCKAIPLDAPWDAKKADKWDSTTVAMWLDHHVRSPAA